MAATSTILLALALSLALFALSASAFDYCSDGASSPDELYLCQRCQFLGRRGGCSSCEAMGPCKWIHVPNRPQDDTCVARSISEESVNSIALRNGLPAGASHTPGLCPADPTQAHRIEIAGTPTEIDNNKFIQEMFPKAYSSDGFCALPSEPFYVDTFAHSYLPTHFSGKEAKFPPLCQVVSNSFGLWVKSSGPSFYEESRAFDKASLLAQLSNCPGSPSGKRDVEEPELSGPASPYDTAMGRECIRAMQSAYCSVGCSHYGHAQGRLCPNQYRDYLYRVCASWTAGKAAYDPVTGPIRNGCPLDPNNLPWDAVNDAFCDGDVFHIQGSSFFENVFGLDLDITKKN